MDKKPVTVGAKEGLGAGIIAIGLMLFFMPSMAQKIADLEYVSSSAFAILLGATYVLSIFVMIGGLSVILAKFKDEDEE